jgi:hypothetical protein
VWPSSHIASLSNGIDGRGEVRVLVQQADSASVESETPGTFIDLVVPEPVPALLPDGPLHPIPSVLDEIWVEGGRLTGVERPWFTDDAPDLWPDAARLDVDER